MCVYKQQVVEDTYGDCLMGVSASIMASATQNNKLSH